MAIPFIDIHTHNPIVSDEIISVPSLFLQDVDFEHQHSRPFTAGIHPWQAEIFKPEEIKTMLERLKGQSGLIAVGETGLDKKCKIDFNLQKKVFELHLDFAIINQRPLIIHCVNAIDEMLYYAKRSDVPFIFHGYNANTELTKQLLRHGFYFSIGKAIIKDNSKLRKALQIIPATSLFFETDDDAIDIREIYYIASAILNCSVE